LRVDSSFCEAPTHSKFGRSDSVQEKFESFPGSLGIPVLPGDHGGAGCDLLGEEDVRAARMHTNEPLACNQPFFESLLQFRVYPRPD